MDGGWDRPFYIRGHKLPVNSRLFLKFFRSRLLNKCHINRSYPQIESAVQSTWNSRYRVFSDNSPQFACAEFRKLSNHWEFEHATSSPRSTIKWESRQCRDRKRAGMLVKWDFLVKRNGPLESARNWLVHDPTKCCVVIRNTDAMDVNCGLLLKKPKKFSHKLRWRASIIWNNITGTSRGTATRVCWIACSVSKDISQCNIFAEASVPRDPVEPSIGPPRARRSTRELDAYQTDCKSESRTHHI